MNNWQDDLLHAADETRCADTLFGKITAAAASLGFENCAYGLRMPLPLSNPKVFTLNNYSDTWNSRYREAGYLYADPTVLHGRRTQTPLVWSDSVFSSARNLWEEARACGLRVGWAKSSLDAGGAGGMLTLSRSRDEISPLELQNNELKMRWLAHVSHISLSRLMMAPAGGAAEKICLTSREVEILRWTADGKTSGEISDILIVSENTVNFHIKNAVGKLQATNRTAAAVKAAMMGLLN